MTISEKAAPKRRRRGRPAKLTSRFRVLLDHYKGMSGATGDSIARALGVSPRMWRYAQQHPDRFLSSGRLVRLAARIGAKADDLAAAIQADMESPMRRK